MIEEKVQRVQSNGLVNIGSRLGGQLVKVRQVNPVKFEIILGEFVSHDTFYSKEAEERLQDFNAWEANNPDSFLSLDDAEKLAQPKSSVKAKSKKR